MELLAVFLIAVILVAAVWLHGARLPRADFSRIDQMTGVEFERAVQNLLRAQGYQVTTTPTSGDLGVDLVATKDGIRTAIQTKRYARPVSRTAVSDVVGALSHYRAQRAMVVTNSTFTEGARTLARSNDCTLIDRAQLAQWIAEEQRSHPAPSTSN